MKRFFEIHSYDMVKMLLNQVAAAVFGFSLAFASGMADNAALRNATGIFSIVFYLFLQYTMTWEIGYKDKVSVELEKKKKHAFTGVWISLCANSINFILAIFIMLASLLPESAISDIGGTCASIAVLFEGMYTGVLANHVGGAPLNSYWFVYFLLPIPSILVCGISYNLGLHDVKFTSFFNRQAYPESDREPTKKGTNKHD